MDAMSWLYLDIGMFLLAIGLAIYVWVKRPDWVLKRYNEMTEYERQKSNINPDKIVRNSVIMLLGAAVLMLALIIWTIVQLV